MLSERSQPQKTHTFYDFADMRSRRGKSIEAKNRLAVSSMGGEGAIGRSRENGEC